VLPIGAHRALRSGCNAAARDRACAQRRMPFLPTAPVSTMRGTRDGRHHAGALRRPVRG
jgi:hypothetical protein